MIRIECPRCGTRLRGPDKSAGTKIKCPKCAGPILVPEVEPIYEAEPVFEKPPLDDDDLATGDPYGLDEPVIPRGGYPPLDDELGEAKRKPCPVCGETIIATAAKCRFCGEVFDAKLKKAKVKKKKKYSADDDDLSTSDIVICLVCPGIACIASVVYMIQGKGKGIKVFGLSILGNVIWTVVRLAVQTANQQGGGP